ncbi:MAG: hypothetical protein SH817_12505 [Leptospira sp.]|nr:hypothetical protein [Leptospira sp.]
MKSFTFEKENLSKEANFLLKELFSIEDNESLANLYVQAHEFILKNPGIEIKDVDIQKIIQKKINPEAVEFAMRIKFRDNLLTKKIQILTYIIESRKEYNGLFNNFNNRFFFGFALLIFMTMRSIFLYFTGRYLISRHHLIRE